MVEFGNFDEGALDLDFNDNATPVTETAWPASQFGAQLGAPVRQNDEDDYTPEELALFEAVE